MLRRARLVGPGLERTWTAPEESPGDAMAEGVAVAAVKSAAAWVRETLAQEGERTLADVVVDTDGASCSWLSAPSPRGEVVVAALMQATAGGADGTGGTSAPVGAAAAATLVSTEASVQALADDEESADAGSRKGVLAKLRGGGGEGGGGAIVAARKRYAVLATPDAPVRVFLDELDGAGIEVDRVSSLWHAMARSWDPGAPGAAGAERAAAGRVIAESAPATAILMIDPVAAGSERLVWAWARGGDLVAGGSMRLRRAPQPVGPGSMAGSPAEDGDVGRAFADAGVEVEGSAGAARRIPAADAGPESASEAPLVCGRSELGRLIVDWLSFSAQLGRAPERVVCLGPATAWIDDEPGRAGGAQQAPYTLAEGLGAAWPGATVDVAQHPDPVGLTLARLRERGLRPDAPPTSTRVALSSLSQRPGRADKRFTRWTAAAVLAAAGAVAVLGWRVHKAAGRAEEASIAAAAARQDLLKTLEKDIPNISRERDPVKALQTRTTEMRQTSASLSRTQPILEETLRLLKAMEGVQDTRLNRINISAAAGLAALEVPDASTAPTIDQRLKSLPGQLIWQYNSPSSRGGEETTRRTVTFTAVWPENRPGGVRPATGGGKP